MVGHQAEGKDRQGLGAAGLRVGQDAVEAQGQGDGVGQGEGRHLPEERGEFGREEEEAQDEEDLPGGRPITLEEIVNADDDEEREQPRVSLVRVATTPEVPARAVRPERCR